MSTIKSGDKNPRPVVGQKYKILEKDSTTIIIIEECDCKTSPKEERWPHGSRCGAHYRIETKDGKTYSSRLLIYCDKQGWRKTVQPINSSNQFKSISSCPICGSNCLDLAVTIYCENQKCQNFHS